MRATAIFTSIIISGILLVTVVTGCSTNPVSGDNQLNLISESEEVRRGQAYHQQILSQNPPYQDSRLQAYVNRIGKMIAAYSHRPNLPYTFTVLDDPAVNAFALPGGYIYITTGLMAHLNSEAELAAVLGHEVGHVAAQHNVTQASWNVLGDILTSVITNKNPSYGKTFGAANNLLQLNYSRRHELQADGLGAQYLARAGYDPAYMATVIALLQAHDHFHGNSSAPYRDLFSTHPNNDQRLQQLIGQARQLGPGTRNPGHETYLNQLNGLRLPLTSGRTVRIRLAKSRPGDTFNTLAQGSPLGSSAVMQLRLINGMYPNGEPRPGQLLKIIQ